MNHRMMLVGAVLTAFVLAPFCGAAQTNTWIGSWKINLAKSKCDHEPALKSDYSAKYDNKDAPFHSPSGDTISLEREGGDVTTATVKKAGKVVSTTSTSVSTDGKTLTQTVRYPDNAKTDVRVHDRQ